LEYTLFQGPHYTGQLFVYLHLTIQRGCRGRDHMVVVFTTTYAISGNHNERCEFEPRSDEVSVTCDRSVVFSGYSGFPHQ